MINPNELRIGNLIKYTGKPYPAYLLNNGIVEVKEVLNDGVNRSQGDSTLYESENLEGIPLTDEWLERCGAVKNRIPLKNGRWHIEYVGEGGLIMRDDLDESEIEILADVNYVHQLQNLYFSLTGEELSIKETV
jgi:hypothetical protein